MLEIISWALVAIAGLPLLMLGAECIAGAAQSIKSPYLIPPPFTVLIPAHDEAEGIASVVRCVRAQLRPGDRVLVVADNCTDDTAAIAAACGADVVERDDPLRRGKAYALAYGRQVLRECPTPIVIIVDADCLPTRGALARLAADTIGHGSTVQGCYLLSLPDEATPLVRFSIFAFMVKNLVRQRGLQRLGGGALLQGTGMAFPWPVFDTAQLETASLVEDLELGLDLRLSGRRVRFDSRAVFISNASAQGATRDQRTRWEHGSLIAAFRYFPKLLLKGLSGRPALLVLAADLAIPPLALLAGINLAIFALLVLLAMATANAAPLLVLTAIGVTAAGALLFIWFRIGRDVLPPRMASQLPRYVLWKLPIYRRLAGDRQVLWVRTSRKS